MIIINLTTVYVVCVVVKLPDLTKLMFWLKAQEQKINEIRVPVCNLKKH